METNLLRGDVLSLLLKKRGWARFSPREGEKKPESQSSLTTREKRKEKGTHHRGSVKKRGSGGEEQHYMFLFKGTVSLTEKRSRKGEASLF